MSALRVVLSAVALATALVCGTSTGPVRAADEQQPVAAPEPEAPRAAASGLPIPRFVSLKADQVNLRAGPGRDYPTSWVYKRAGLPLEVLKEYDVWREVRDAEGTQGWIIQSLLSGRRTALIQPWDAKDGKVAATIDIRSSDNENSSVVVTVEAGVIANIMSCDKRWCSVSVDKYRGYVEQKKLWGVYENEEINN
jgi:SH3-like domain-containing protein